MCELVAIADLDEKRLKRLQKKHPQVTVYTNYKEVLRRSDIDTVHICLPHHLHAKIGVETLEAGKQVLCEKPIATTLEEADAMIQAARARGVILMVAENQRFLPAHIRIKELLDAGIIGEPKLIITYEGGSEVASMSDPDSWKSKLVEGGGGAWMDSGIHRVAVLQYLFGDIDSISGKAERLYVDVETKADDNCAFSVQFANGTLGTVACSFTVASEWNNTLEIYGTKGTILENHNWEQPIKLFSSLRGPDQGKWVSPEVEHKVYPGYYPLTFEAETRHFYECVINDSEPLITGEDGRRALEIILLGYEASRTGKTAYRDKKS
jgi:predicted dehydrogenase